MNRGLVSITLPNPSLPPFFVAIHSIPRSYQLAHGSAGSRLRPRPVFRPKHRRRRARVAEAGKVRRVPQPLRFHICLDSSPSPYLDSNRALERLGHHNGVPRRTGPHRAASRPRRSQPLQYAHSVRRIGLRHHGFCHRSPNRRRNSRCHRLVASFLFGSSPRLGSPTRVVLERPRLGCRRYHGTPFTSSTR